MSFSNLYVKILCDLVSFVNFDKPTYSSVLILHISLSYFSVSYYVLRFLYHLLVCRKSKIGVKMEGDDGSTMVYYGLLLVLL